MSGTVGGAAGTGETGEFGADAVVSEAYGLRTVDVPAGRWLAALRIARDELGCTFFDWLSAVDEGADGFRVCAHVVALGAPPRGVLLRTLLPREAPSLPSATGVYAGAAWHERETREMFGVDFPGHPGPAPLLLPESFEGHPLRKDFVLAARVAKAWPGAKEPGESGHGGPKRRQTLPPGVPDPNEWGPLKGQLPAAPARPARGARRGAAAGGEEGAARPPRRTRSATGGSASQRGEGPEASPEAPRAPRRARSASQGSASQRGEGPAASETPRGPRRSRSASDGSASQRAATGGGETSGAEEARPPGRRPRGGDAPWHDPRPAYGPDADGGPAAETADGPEPPRSRDGEQGSEGQARTASGEPPTTESRDRDRDQDAARDRHNDQDGNPDPDREGDG
ncbi:NADH-quinone oxidoreductase subunit C [Streptomyces carpaticus]|uniref:NADH-quinone oxidoreductase subunit C n=2 Tax=Streptomyces carpaticus TaxID=285558 RepID=UPI00321FD62A